MANPDLPPGALMKPTHAVLLKRTKQKAADTEWRRCCTRVDERDKRRCFVTGKSLQAGAVDPWQALERHHIEPRSLAKSRRCNHHNIVTVARAIHQLIHAGALKLLDQRGVPAKTFDAIDAVQWNRLLVAKGDEPCRVRRGLAVSERTPA